MNKSCIKKLRNLLKKKNNEKIRQLIQRESLLNKTNAKNYNKKKKKMGLSLKFSTIIQ